MSPGTFKEAEASRLPYHQFLEMVFQDELNVREQRTNFDCTPCPSGKRSDGVRSGKSAGCANVGLWKVLMVLVLLQLRDSYPCIRISRSERQFDLFVSVKGNVDTV